MFSIISCNVKMMLNCKNSILKKKLQRVGVFLLVLEVLVVVFFLLSGSWHLVSTMG